MGRAPIPNMSLKPPLKWAGGKRWQLPYLLPLYRNHSHRRLVEPFCGGLAVALGLNPQSALLNDINPHLINFYGWLKKGFTSSIAMENDKELFYAHRQRFNNLVSLNKIQTKEAAALFYYLNRTGYNGLCRFNRSGEFNVPFGRYKSISYVTQFSRFKAAFAKWDFVSSDFSNISLDKSDFIYADPPYDVEFTSYASEGFSWDDQVRAAEYLACHPGPVILVNQSTKRITTLYRHLGFKLRHLTAPRRISSSGDRSPVIELFATRNI